MCICFRVRQARGKTAQTSQIEQEQRKNTELEQAADDSEVLLCCSLRLQQLANTAACARPISPCTVSLCSVGFSQAASPGSTCMCTGLCSHRSLRSGLSRQRRVKGFIITVRKPGKVRHVSAVLKCPLLNYAPPQTHTHTNDL